MPRGDGTGPMGQGMMTGRKRGNCAGYNSWGPGCGLGYGRRTGRGRFNEKEIIKSEPEAEALKKLVDQLSKRLGELEKK